MEALSQWGCDIPSALERFDGDEELYVECLEIFANDKNFEDLPQKLQEKDYEGAFNAAHSLKGVAANLSLGPLLEAISLISDKLKAGDYAVIEQNYPKLVEAKKKYDEIVKAGK